MKQHQNTSMYVTEKSSCLAMPMQGTSECTDDSNHGIHKELQGSNQAYPI